MSLSALLPSFVSLVLPHEHVYLLHLATHPHEHYELQHGSPDRSSMLQERSSMLQDNTLPWGKDMELKLYGLGFRAVPGFRFTAYGPHEAGLQQSSSPRKREQ